MRIIHFILDTVKDHIGLIVIGSIVILICISALISVFYSQKNSPIVTTAKLNPSTDVPVVDKNTESFNEKDARIWWNKLTINFTLRLPKGRRSCISNGI
jgi:hypothetical protein